MLRSNLCDHSDAYIVVKETHILLKDIMITIYAYLVEGDNDVKKKIKRLTFKNNSSFRSSISKINNTFRQCRTS